MKEKTSDKPLSMAGLETHEKVLELVEKFAPEPVYFLDLGAGQGAFSKKLKDLGHSVVAVDGNAENWKVKEIEILQHDLDKDYAEKILIRRSDKKFDGVVAIEILEHIENPFNFVRESAKLLKKGGLLFLTTPNVESVSSRLIFLYTGRLKHFGEYETVRPAHITPIFRWKLEMILAEAGFEIIHEDFNRNAYRTGENLKGRMAGLVARGLEKFLKGTKGGECRIIVARLI